MNLNIIVDFCMFISLTQVYKHAQSKGFESEIKDCLVNPQVKKLTRIDKKIVSCFSVFFCFAKQQHC